MTHHLLTDLLFAARQQGGLVVCASVYAELLAYPGATGDFVDAFLEDTRINVEVNLPRQVWARAGEAFSAHAKRRREDRAGHPKRLLVDFVVGRTLS
ncbi:hypothetical protein BH24DEI1_BH24DEI1_09280 [soil metagenome]